MRPGGIAAGRLDDACRFSARAMGSVFEVFIRSEDPVYAQQAATASFDQLKELERELSFFLPGSDVFRINRARAGETIRVGLSTFDCLEAARAMHERTYGAFDVTAGFPAHEKRDNKDEGAAPSFPAEKSTALCRQVGTSFLELDPETRAVRKKVDGVQVDLGGVGKGFAVDRMVALLRSWSIENALVHGGNSSVYASGAGPDGGKWPLSLPDPRTPGRAVRILKLQDSAVSGSGLEKGAHVFDPRTCRPVGHVRAAWAVADTACVSDMMSTAIMVMSTQERARFQKSNPEMECIVISENETA